MKKTASINSIRVAAQYQEKLLERYVNKYMPGLPDSQTVLSRSEKVPTGYKKIDCCFVRIPVTGRMDINFAGGIFGMDKTVRVPVNSFFVVTCTRDSSGRYKAAWACSLS